MHINERLDRNYILLPVRIHMPNYNIFIKSECNFHKRDYKRSTRSGKALSILPQLGWWCQCGTENDLRSLTLFRDYVFKTKHRDGIKGRWASTNELYINDFKIRKDRQSSLEFWKFIYVWTYYWWPVLMYVNNMIHSTYKQKKPITV